MLKEHDLNRKNNFIEGYYISDLSICDDLINLFETSKNKRPGQSSRGIDKTIKDSLDLIINESEIKNHLCLKLYFQEMIKCLILYKTKYKYCNLHMNSWGLEENFNIQKYEPKQAYHLWHTETSGIITGKRHLVFMTYLNDVKKGGETEWYYQKIKIKPEKGLTVVWSADWTFTHKGHTTIDEDKYIITGWYEYKE
jgi:hypothetical protein